MKYRLATLCTLSLVVLLLGTLGVAPMSAAAGSHGLIVGRD